MYSKFELLKNKSIYILSRTYYYRHKFSIYFSLMCISLGLYLYNNIRGMKVELEIYHIHEIEDLVRRNKQQKKTTKGRDKKKI